MKIGIDARALKWPKTGIGKYVNEVVRFLDRDAGEHVTLFADKPVPVPDKFSGDQVIFTAPRRFVWENNILPDQVEKAGVDVYHAAWNYGLSKSMKCACLLTVHDVIPVVLEDLYFTGIVERIFYRTMYLQSMRASVNRADFINADSECTKHDLIRLFNVLDSKLRVVYLGHDPIFKPIEDSDLIDNVLTRHGITRPYIIYSGGFDVRKNLMRLVDAWEMIISDKPDHRLIIVGEINEYGTKVKDYVKSKALKDKVMFTGYITDADVVALLNAAELAVYPSLYEGFGLPPVEAMACGTPVAASARASIPEIINGAGSFFDPTDTADMARVIREALDRPDETEVRRSFATKRAAEFTWTQTVESVYESYLIAMENHARGRRK